MEQDVLSGFAGNQQLKKKKSIVSYRKEEYEVTPVHLSSIYWCCYPPKTDLQGW